MRAVCAPVPFPPPRNPLPIQLPPRIVLSALRTWGQINMLRTLPLNTRWYKTTVPSPLCLESLHLMCEKVRYHPGSDRDAYTHIRERAGVQARAHPPLTRSLAYSVSLAHVRKGLIDSLLAHRAFENRFACVALR